MTVAEKPALHDRFYFRGEEWAQSPEIVAQDCRWIGHPALRQTPAVVAFKRVFRVSVAQSVELEVSADERYELFIDGQLLGRGPERGCQRKWYSAPYRLELTPGEHVLAARVWALGEFAPKAQFTVCPGLIVLAHGPLRDTLTTGIAPWLATTLNGYSFTHPGDCWGRGSNTRLDGRDFAHDFTGTQTAGWTEANALHPAITQSSYGEFPENHHILCRAALPAQTICTAPAPVVRFAHPLVGPEELQSPIAMSRHDSALAQSFTTMLEAGQPVHIPANTTLRLLLDFNDYVCCYPHLSVNDGRDAEISFAWAEALFGNAEGREESKVNRDLVDGLWFRGWGDAYLCGGGAETFTPLWWQAGRYAQVVIHTAAQPLNIRALTFQQTGYPAEWKSELRFDDQRLTDIVPVMRRAMQMCMHETYMDCPYYEQLMYVGDTRLEALVTYTSQTDARLPRKAVELFAASRLPEGPTRSRFPGNWQLIPPFSLWWIGMLYDYALWRGGHDFIRRLIPEARAIIDYFLLHRAGSGLVQSPAGWNFMDWVPEWPVGIPPGGRGGESGVINWQLVLALDMLRDLERWAGEPECAARYDRVAGELTAELRRTRWDAGRGLFAEDAAHTEWAEHSNALAVLSKRLAPAEEAAIAAGIERYPDLAQTTIYFTHYLFEMQYRLGQGNALIDRLGLWFNLPADGFKTTPECPAPMRSDCHAWGAHPLYHYYATLLGVRPLGFGYERVRISPCPCSLKELTGDLVHPAGTIRVRYQRTGDQFEVAITLPEGLCGEWEYRGDHRDLPSGESAFTICDKQNQ